MDVLFSWRLMIHARTGRFFEGSGGGRYAWVGYFLCEVPSNIILYKIGARVWIARIMITWGIISALFAFVETAWQFYALRFLLGVA